VLDRLAGLSWSDDEFLIMKKPLIPSLCAFVVSGCALSAPEKANEIRSCIDAQTGIVDICDRVQDPFVPRTLDLRPDVQEQIRKIIPDATPSETLFRLGIACALAACPGLAGDQAFDRIHEEAAWRCVYLLTDRPGNEAADYLERMKEVFGRDGGNSLLFKDAIAFQRKKSEHATSPDRVQPAVSSPSDRAE
jgi:hypothetical protein